MIGLEVFGSGFSSVTPILDTLLRFWYLWVFIAALIIFTSYNHIIFLINRMGSGNMGKLCLCKIKYKTLPSGEKLKYLKSMSGKFQFFYPDMDTLIPAKFGLLGLTFAAFRGGVNNERLELKYTVNPKWERLKGFFGISAHSQTKPINIEYAQEFGIKEDLEPAYFRVKPQESNLLFRNERELNKQVFAQKADWFAKWGMYVVPIGMIMVFLVTIIVSYQFYAKAGGGVPL